MAIFQKLGETIVSTGKDVTKKTKDLTGVAKLKLEIASKEDDLKRLYIELGKQYYNEHKKDEEPVYDQIDQIKILKEEIRLLQEDVRDIRNVKQCPNCGTEVKDNAAYCSTCGSKISIFEDGD